MKNSVRVGLLAGGLLVLYGLADYAGIDLPRRPGTSGLDLRVRAVPGRSGATACVSVVAAVRNDRAEAVTLVRPTDGSCCGRQMPIIEWSLTKVDEPLPWKRHPLRDLLASPGCGNVNAITDADIITLQPGEVVDLGPWTRLDLVDPGTYRVTLHYKNRPVVLPASTLDGPLEPSVVRGISESLACDLHSNTITISIPSGAGTNGPGQRDGSD